MKSRLQNEGLLLCCLFTMIPKTSSVCTETSKSMAIPSCWASISISIPEDIGRSQQRLPTSTETMSVATSMCFHRLATLSRTNTAKTPLRTQESKLILPLLAACGTSCPKKAFGRATVGLQILGRRLRTRCSNMSTENDSSPPSSYLLRGPCVCFASSLHDKAEPRDFAADIGVTRSASRGLPGFLSFGLRGTRGSRGGGGTVVRRL